MGALLNHVQTVVDNLTLDSVSAMAVQLVQTAAVALTLYVVIYILFNLFRAKRVVVSSPPKFATAVTADAESLPLDKSELTAAIMSLAEHVHESQIIDAGALLVRVQRTIAANVKSRQAREAEAALAAAIDAKQLEARYQECKSALMLLSSDEGWILAYEIGGIATFTRKDKEGA